jgi:hypothetical protein
MGTRHLLDAQGGVVTTFEYDNIEDGVIINTQQDVTPYLERNKRLQNEGRHHTKDKSFQFAASIPIGIAHKWMVEDGVNWMALPKPEKSLYLRRKLNDPQYRYLKVSEGAF